MAQYFDGRSEDFKDIPKAPFYVLSNDRFMSGWGKARGKINTCVVPCMSMQQAQKVERYIGTRSDQHYIRIVSNPPRSKKHVLYSLQLGWLERCLTTN